MQTASDMDVKGNATNSTCPLLGPGGFRVYLKVEDSYNPALTAVKNYV